VTPERAARHTASSSVAPICPHIGAPCVLALHSRIAPRRRTVILFGALSRVAPGKSGSVSRIARFPATYSPSSTLVSRQPLSGTRPVFQVMPTPTAMATARGTAMRNDPRSTTAQYCRLCGLSSAVRDGHGQCRYPLHRSPPPASVARSLGIRPVADTSDLDARRSSRSGRKREFCRDYGGGGNRTRVRGCTDRTSTSVVRAFVSLGGRGRTPYRRASLSFGCRASGDRRSVGS